MKSSELNSVEDFTKDIDSNLLMVLLFYLFPAVYNFDTTVLDLEVLQQIYEVVSVSKFSGSTHSTLTT